MLRLLLSAGLLVDLRLERILPKKAADPKKGPR